MEEKLEEISKRILADIRKLLKSKNIFDNNFDVELKVGRYKIDYYRNINSKYKELIELPNEFYEILKKYIEEIDVLWNDIGNEEEAFEDRTTSEHSISIYIEGIEYSIQTIEEINFMIKSMEDKLQESIVKEDYEEAARLKKRIEFYKNQLKDL